MVRITNIQIANSFSLNELLYHSAVSVLKEAESTLNGSTSITNVPDDAPPVVPRVVLRSDDCVLQISQERIQLVVYLPDQVSSNLDKAIKFAREKYKSWTRETTDKLNFQYTWTGVIGELEFPNPGSPVTTVDKVTAPVFDKMLSFFNRKNDPVCTLDLNFGVTRSNKYINYRVKGYETRHGVIEVPPGGPNRLNLNAKDFQLEESGITVIVDVNNKPGIGSNRDPKSDSLELLRTLSSLTNTVTSDLSLEGIIE